MEEEIEIFDVEMQTENNKDFISRTFEYGISLRDTLYIEEKAEEIRKKNDMGESYIEEQKKKKKKKKKKLKNILLKYYPL